ncbi:KAP family P-loop NTPase fold protein [Aeromonas salmonicida]|uniref:KAP family P-loop NTPase fold protein n=1 Tax=Aeromonas salmonicida TaxID=645 RepID=UPI00259E9DE2|nr:P-loop NTPase fold protein [Aeromonas salmonicida]MDM5150068.1 KAP family NTPase [Aeromonas salmonicida]
MTLAAFNWGEPLPWDGPGAIDGVVEELAGDRLDRARYAEFLTNYLAAEGKQRNYVLNLNAEWGAGKTWFIKRWYMELKQHYPTVYIDAWQQDFSDDPLLTVISSIIDQLRIIAGKENKIPDGMRQRLLGLFKVGGKLALKAALKKAGLEDEDFSLEGEDANQLVDALCSNQKERYDSIQYLKEEIRQWVEGAVVLGKGHLDYPAFILIDELDRCRPSYAVEMLETIKHIFDIPGVVFVLATDTEQLQHAVKVIYGDGFDAQNYLGRFFQRRFTLNRKSRREFISNILEIRTLPDGSTMVWPELINPRVLLEVVTAVSDSLELSLRQTEQIIDRLLFVMQKPRRRKVNLVFLMYLFALHEKDYQLYSGVADGALSYAQDKFNEKTFTHKISLKKDAIMAIFIRANTEIGGIIAGTYGKGDIENPFDDTFYNVSLSEIMCYSYQFMLNNSYRHRDDHELKVIAEKFDDNGTLNVQENSILAKKELSLLECDLSLYKNLVELAVHLE